MYNSASHISPGRLWSFYSAILAAIVIFTIQLIRLQVVDYEGWEAQAVDNRQDIVNLPAQRGVIYDRNGVVLARNVPSFNVAITPANLPDDHVRLQAIYQRISELTGVPITTPPLDAGNASSNRPGEDAPPPGVADVVYLQESIAPYDSVVVAPDVPREVALILSEELRNLPGISIEVSALRDYPTGALTAHVIGYMGPITREVEDEYVTLGFDPSRDKIGYAGIEAYMQQVLAGKNGSKLIEQDVAGLELRTVGDVVQPVPGYSLVLTIDVRLQAVVEAAVRNQMRIENQLREGQPVTNGVGIAMDPRTGEILSLVSLPTYDNQHFARFIPLSYYNDLLDHPHRPLFNNAISGEHPPGSVFKLVVASGALQEGIVTVDQTVFDPGEINITNRYFPNDPGKTRKVVCYKRDGHGDVDFITGISESCDVYFYALGGGYDDGEVSGGGLGIDRMNTYARMLGYDELTGLELPGESKGLMPSREWKRINIGENWSTGDTYISAIGQGYVLATPLQVLNSFTPFINNGALLKPTLLREVLDGEGNIVQEFDRSVIHYTPLSSRVIEQVSLGLRQVMIDGTGKELEKIDGINLAGKSGTAEYCDNLAQAADRCKFGAWPAHSWFVGYGPFEEPEIAVIAFFYSGEEGSTVAGVVVQNILDAYFALRAIDRSSSD